MKTSVYMTWSKQHAAARYNLANSGILGCNLSDLTLTPDDFARIPLVATRSLYPGGDPGEHPLASSWWWLAAGTVMLLSLATLARRYSREQP